MMAPCSGRTDRGALGDATCSIEVGAHVPYKLADGASELDRLVLGDQGVAVGDLDQSRPGEELGEPLAVFGRHDAILSRPDASKAGAGETLVSQTVKDLVSGSGIEFQDRGLHALKGVPGEWHLYEVN